MSASTSVPASGASLFFSNNTPPPEISTLSLHDALPILSSLLHRACSGGYGGILRSPPRGTAAGHRCPGRSPDRKSTRLNSSHVSISYAVFCLKKKNKNIPSYYCPIHQHFTFATSAISGA